MLCFLNSLGLHNYLSSSSVFHTDSDSYSRQLVCRHCFFPVNIFTYPKISRCSLFFHISWTRLISFLRKTWPEVRVRTPNVKCNWTVASRGCGWLQIFDVTRRWNLCPTSTLILLLTLNDPYDAYSDHNRTSRRVCNILCAALWLLYGSTLESVLGPLSLRSSYVGFPCPLIILPPSFALSPTYQCLISSVSMDSKLVHSLHSTNLYYYGLTSVLYNLISE